VIDQQKEVVVDRSRLAMVYSGSRVFIGNLEGGSHTVEYVNLFDVGEFICQRQIDQHGAAKMLVLVIGLAANQGPVKELIGTKSDALLWVTEEVMGARAYKSVLVAYEKFLDLDVSDKLDKIVLPSRVPIPKDLIKS
jgi:hypothetical protein